MTAVLIGGPFDGAVGRKGWNYPAVWLGEHDGKLHFTRSARAGYVKYTRGDGLRYYYGDVEAWSRGRSLTVCA